MNISALKKEIDVDFKKIKTDADCGSFHQKFLSKSGKVTLLMRELGKLEQSQRAKFGAELNSLKRSTEEKLFTLQDEIKRQELNAKLLQDKLIDITIPDLSGKGMGGTLHPITLLSREVEEVFASMGFIVADGPEIVTEFENFESVNVPADHPARDMQDTFWLSDGRVLKTHTSALQNILLKKYGPTFRAVFPGRCFRNEATDASHENTFFQVEGMMVGEDISIANLIYFMKEMLAAIFKKDIKVRLRPGYFPFVEPGFELDASCMFCGAKGCSVCKHAGWIELCPCGMIHPNVLKYGGIDSEEYTGFAFGLGLTRLAMMKYGVRDIRTFNSCNLRALSQFINS